MHNLLKGSGNWKISCISPARRRIKAKLRLKSMRGNSKTSKPLHNALPSTTTPNPRSKSPC